MNLIESQQTQVKNRRRRRGRFASGPIGTATETGEAMDVVAGVTGTPYEATISRHIKRLLDMLMAVGLAILILPVLILVAIAIKCVSSGPVLYGQVRLGKNGKPFRIWKFRTMFVDAESRLDEYLKHHPDLREQWATEFKLKDDPRVVPWIGNLLRKSGLDELPQLWNVLVGEMSLVGPRPLPQYHVDQFDEEFRLLRVAMPPGITGQWQICSRNDGAPEMFEKWDTYYVHNWSIGLDLLILLRTTWVVLWGSRSRNSVAAEAADETPYQP